MPIHSRTIFLAKVGALALFLLAFTASVNLVSVVTFPAVSYRGPTQGLLGAIAAQGISILASSAFAFLLLVALEGVLLNVLSVRWFRKVSAYVQGAMVFVLLWLFCVLPHIAATVAEMKERNSWVLYAFPPLWFLGLNEAMIGTRDAVLLALAHRAEIALGLVALVAGVVVYGRAIEGMSEGRWNRPRASDSTRTAMHERIGRIADLGGAGSGGARDGGVRRQDDGAQREASHFPRGVRRRRIRAGGAGDACGEE